MAYTQQYSVNEAFLLFIWLDTSILTCVQWTFRRKGSVKGGTDLQHNKKGVVNYWREIEKELPLHSVRLQSISQIAIVTQDMRYHSIARSRVVYRTFRLRVCNQ
ncbi:hypothetical protein RIR_jg7352.t1 [Rhizophagus irregularis DAOM 181602=DAOM 197198]|nr:hypothetical protein RIR_jg7352.t1 [Rhizophagus irregularis DAOM 181602=DAOM 197198]